MTLPEGHRRSSSTFFSNSSAPISIINTLRNEKQDDNSKEGIKKALIVGISSYKNLHSLEFCKKDGNAMHDLLKNLGYDVDEKNILIGEITFDVLRKTIICFFTNNKVRAKDTLLFYFSGHGIPDNNDETYIATSDVDPNTPYENGYSFDELTKMMLRSISKRIVMILDCCCSGSATITKGSDEEAATLSRIAINKKSKKLDEGEGKCLLASSLAGKDSYAAKGEDHSLFTHYLLQGLGGKDKEAVDNDGLITPFTLGEYLYNKVTQVHPNQKPILKTESIGKIILANYPQFKQSSKWDKIHSLLDDGNYASRRGRYEESISIYDEILELDEKYHAAWYYKATSLFRLKKFKEAIDCFDKALKLKKDCYYYWTDKGSTLMSLERYDEALGCFEVSLKIKATQNIDAVIGKGNALKLLKRYGEAIDCYNIILEIDPNNRGMLSEKAVTLESISRYKEAIDCYKKIQNIDSNYKEKLNPDFTEALRAKGAALEKIAKETPPSVGKNISTILYDGIRYLENEDYDNAIKSFDECIALDPTNSILYNYKGDALFKLGRYEEAIKSYDEALKINPNYFDVLKDKGKVLDALGSFDKAIDCYNKAIAIRPKNAQIWFFKGLSLYRLSKYDEAIRCFDESLRIDIKFDDAKKYKELALGLQQKKAPSSTGLSYEDSDKTMNPQKKDDTSSLSSEKIKPSSIPKSSKTAIPKSLVFEKSWEIKEQPRYVAVDSKGYVYTIAYTIVYDTKKEVSYVYKHDNNGSLVTIWGSEGPADGQFNNLICIAIDSKDCVYVADSLNHRVQKFDSDGNFLAKWGSYGSADGQFSYPQGIAVDSKGHVYVADTFNKRIQKFDNEGNFLAKLGSYGSADGQFVSPRCIAIDSKDCVYVADIYNYRVQKFDNEGNFLAKLGSYGSADGQFNYPQGIAVDSKGHVYVADSYNHRVQKFDNEGNFLAKLGSEGSHDGQFISPRGIAIDSNDCIYVADSSNHRVQKWK